MSGPSPRDAAKAFDRVFMMPIEQCARTECSLRKRVPVLLSGYCCVRCEMDLGHGLDCDGGLDAPFYRKAVSENPVLAEFVDLITAQIESVTVAPVVGSEFDEFENVDAPAGRRRAFIL